MDVYGVYAAFSVHRGRAPPEGLEGKGSMGLGQDRNVWSLMQSTAGNWENKSLSMKTVDTRFMALRIEQNKIFQREKHPPIEAPIATSFISVREYIGQDNPNNNKKRDGQYITGHGLPSLLL
jgi:hypothetical protein